MIPRKPLSLAVHAATFALVGAGYSAGAFAQDDEEAAVEEVVVTGSRIQRAVSDAPSPVTVISAEDLEFSGLSNVADVLRNTTYNSFGSFRERSGTSFGQIALVDLRGLGAGRTAVLINGRRVPGNPFTGSSAVDVNSIPLSAVERIEILTDSASAVYGADAIGGVINFIMKDDYEGAEILIGQTSPEASGADEERAQFVFGASGDKGKVIASVEYYQRDAIFDADRDYSAAQVNGPSFGDTVGVSVGGNTGFVPGFPSNPFPIGDCPTDTYAGVLDNPFGIPGQGCGFGYADISAQTGAIDRISTFVDASYDVNADTTVYMESRYSRIESFGRYAPAVGFFFVDEGQRLANQLTPILTGDLAAAADTDGSGVLEPGEGFFAFHRFVGHGPRDDVTDRHEFDFVIGMEGSVGGVSYDVFARKYFYSADEIGDTYVLNSVIRDLAASGAYDVVNPAAPSNAAAVGLSSADLFRDLKTDFTQVGFSLTGSAFELPGGSVGWAIGGEVAREDYRDQYDSYREAGNVIGSAGNSASGDRQRDAFFVETSLPVIDSLEINLAARYDYFSDFGSNVASSVSVRYEPTDWMVLRASYNEGFKAPDLTNLYQSRSQSFNNVTDFIRCDAQGIEPIDCPTFQVENFTGGNPLLQAEEAESTNIGVVFSPVEGLRFSMDYFEVDTTDRATSLSLSRLLQLAAIDQLPPGTAVNRGPGEGDGIPGAIISIDNVITNAAALNIEGYDMRLTYELDMGFGDLYIRSEYSHLDSYTFQSAPGDPSTEFMGEGGFPEDRFNTSVRFTVDNLTANYTFNYIGDHGDGELQNYSDYTTHDITVEYQTPVDGLALTLGSLNFTDEKPVLDSIGGYDDGVTGILYDLAGRRIFGSIRYTF
jgi:iron complex outermembrane receptor protein